MSAAGGKADLLPTCPECPPIAEAVEKLGAIGFSATIVPIS